MKFHCLFEQSGTFKNEFKKLGFESYDYDILNDYNETDYQIDLFNEINAAYKGGESVFDNFEQQDQLIAFFPCVRFEDQIILWFRGDNYGQAKWNDEQKLEYDLKIQQELCELYCLITKLAIVCIRKNLKLIIENPYTTQHYLYRYWSLKPKLIDYDRTERGDWYKKPTQYWFINCEPKNNFVLEPKVIHKKKVVQDERGADRSLISPQYANRFIREFLLEENYEY